MQYKNQSVKKKGYKMNSKTSAVSLLNYVELHVMFMEGLDEKEKFSYW